MILIISINEWIKRDCLYQTRTWCIRICTCCGFQTVPYKRRVPKSNRHLRQATGINKWAPVLLVVFVEHTIDCLKATNIVHVICGSFEMKSFTSHFWGHWRTTHIIFFPTNEKNRIEVKILYIFSTHACVCLWVNCIASRNGDETRTEHKAIKISKAREQKRNETTRTNFNCNYVYFVCFGIMRRTDGDELASTFDTIELNPIKPMLNHRFRVYNYYDWSSAYCSRHRHDYLMNCIDPSIKH